MYEPAGKGRTSALLCRYVAPGGFGRLVIKEECPIDTEALFVLVLLEFLLQFVPSSKLTAMRPASSPERL